MLFRSYESDGAVLSRLAGVWRQIGELAAIDPSFEPFLKERDGIKAGLEELAAHLRRYAGAVEASPERLSEVERRLALLEGLKRKYGPTLRDCLARRAAIEKELSELAHGGIRVAELEREQQDASDHYRRTAAALSAARHEVAAALQRSMESSLQDLAMTGARFAVMFAEPALETEWSARGMDRAEFFVSPNPGEDLRPLARIASGGELSRLMLALKVMTARARLHWDESNDRPPSGAAPGLIFDEVDAGIGGRVAEVVGRNLYGLGSAFQVLCITHLPQIAAYADAHYAIEKHVRGGRTTVSIVRLEGEARVAEIGRMLGGGLVTEGLRASAEEMLRLRRVGRPATAGRREVGGESERAKAKGRRGA